MIPNFAVISLNKLNCPPPPVLFAGWLLTAWAFPVRAHDHIIWLFPCMSFQSQAVRSAPYAL